MFSLAGKVALVTGASRGLGWAMARSLAHAGATVLINGRDAATLQPRVDELAKAGLKGEVAAFDVTDEKASEACIQDAVRRLGRFDILVANAGIQHRRPISEFETADFQRVIDTNLTAVWALARAAARVMIPRKAGRIIMTGSASAILARPTISAYVARITRSPRLALWAAAPFKQISPRPGAPGIAYVARRSPLVTL